MVRRLAGIADNSRRLLRTYLPPRTILTDIAATDFGHLVFSNPLYPPVPSLQHLNGNIARHKLGYGILYHRRLVRRFEWLRWLDVYDRELKPKHESAGQGGRERCCRNSCWFLSRSRSSYWQCCQFWCSGTRLVTGYRLYVSTFLGVS